MVLEETFFKAASKVTFQTRQKEPEGSKFAQEATQATTWKASGKIAIQLTREGKRGFFQSTGAGLA